MAKSKSEVLGEYIRRVIREECFRIVGESQPDCLLKHKITDVATSVSWKIAHHPYGRMELEDIMRWKIRRPHWE